jgi:hypothetical protein
MGDPGCASVVIWRQDNIKLERGRDGKAMWDSRGYSSQVSFMQTKKPRISA